MYFKILEKIGWKTIPYFNNKKKKYGKYYSTNNQTLSPEVNQTIYNALLNKKPLLIGRHGAVELRLITNVLAYKNQKNTIIDSIKYLTNDKAKFWKIDTKFRNKLCYNAGFFPNEIPFLEKFTQLYLEKSKLIDVYGASTGVEHLLPSLPNHIPTTYIKNIEPWFYKHPWTKALEGKKVLIVYPLKEVILSQYKKRELLFENKDILPEFDLKVIQAVQTIADEKSQFKDWFEALEHMKKQMKNTDFDIAIIGAGAYGFPLAAYAKELGKKAIHFGGATQILFGIKGSRWMQWERYTKLMNEHWVYPQQNQIPKGAQKIEDNAYW